MRLFAVAMLAVCLRAPIPAHADDPPGGPLQGVGARTIIVGTLRQADHLPGMSNFPQRPGDFHRLVYRNGLVLSVPHVDAPVALGMADAQAVCRSAPPGRFDDVVITTAPVTTDGTVQIVGCPSGDENTTIFYIAARRENGVWTTLSRVGGTNPLLSYDPGSHCGLILERWVPTTFGSVGTDGLMRPQAGSSLASLMIESDPKVMEQFADATLRSLGVRDVEEGPGWAHIIDTEVVEDPGSTASFSRNAMVEFHYLADAYRPGIARVQFDLNGGRNHGLYPAPENPVVTLRGAWKPITTPAGSTHPESHLLYPQPQTLPREGSVLISLGPSVAPLRVAVPGSGPDLTIARATKLFHAWVGDEIAVGEDVKRSMINDLGTRLDAEGFVPLVADGGLVLIRTVNVLMGTPEYFLAARVDGEWRLAAYCVDADVVLTWDAERRSGFVYGSDRPTFVRVAELALQAQIVRLDVDVSTIRFSNRMGGQDSVGDWTGIEDGRIVTGTLHVRFTNPAPNMWRVEVVE